jgi:hypothetical protein
MDKDFDLIENKQIKKIKTFIWYSTVSVNIITLEQEELIYYLTIYFFSYFVNVLHPTLFQIFSPRMVWRNRQNMYASHFTNCLLGFLAYMNIAFCWPQQGFQLTLTGLVVTNSYHPPHLSIANSYLQDAKLPDLCVPLPLELLFLVLSNLQCGALHYICVTAYCINKVHHTSSKLPSITDPSQPNLHRL